jgi:5-formyltetrahydrofolate cyclo-ligase
MTTTPASADWPAVRTWRVATRRTLIAARLALPPEQREQLSEQARRQLQQRVDLQRFASLGIYWPVRGEIDVRDLACAQLARGCSVGLPVVVTPFAPVEFWCWEPQDPMTRGVWNIPIPAQRRVMQPQALIVPLVGFDERRYRLGYGGGYYDRTLAQAAPRPYCIGLGYAAGRLDSIYPQTHDIAMDVIVTDAG